LLGQCDLPTIQKEFDVRHLRTRRRLYLLAGLIALALPACSDGPADPSDGGQSNGTVTATLDGSAWKAAHVLAVKTPASTQWPSGQFLLVGYGATTGVNIGIIIPAVAGTYALGRVGPGQVMNVGSASIDANTGDARWEAGSFSGSGSIVLTSITTTAARGTFTFTLEPASNTAATGTRTVTNGSYNVTF
jgi:hypothetical protein